MLGMRVDAVFDKTLHGAEARVWGRFAAWLSKRGAVPRVRKDIRAPLACGGLPAGASVDSEGSGRLREQ